jgi:hypothetical protein
MRKAGILCLLVSMMVGSGYGQEYKGFTVYRNKKDGTQKAIQAVSDSCWVHIDISRKYMMIASKKDGILIEGHSMKKLSDTRYLFHKYDKENSDFELEIFTDSVTLHTHMSFWSPGYKYNITFQTVNIPLLSAK